MLVFNSLGKNLPSVKTSEAQMIVRALPVYKGPKQLTRVIYATGEFIDPGSRLSPGDVG